MIDRLADHIATARYFVAEGCRARPDNLAGRAAAYSLSFWHHTPEELQRCLRSLEEADLYDGRGQCGWWSAASSQVARALWLTLARQAA